MPQTLVPPAAGVVDVVLIPEIPFELDLLIEYVAKTLDKKGHVVICVAEGAGQDVLGAESIGADASGNPILKDIGTFLRDTFKARLKVLLPIRWVYMVVYFRIFSKTLLFRDPRNQMSGLTATLVMASKSGIHLTALMRYWQLHAEHLNERRKV